MEQSINQLMKVLQKKKEKVLAGGGEKESQHNMKEESLLPGKEFLLLTKVVLTELDLL